MSSYNKKQKEYANKLLKKHVSSFRINEPLNKKYSIIDDKGMFKVDDKLINHLTKETGLSKIQAIDIVIDAYETEKSRLDYLRSRHEYNTRYTYEFKKKKRERDRELTVDDATKGRNAFFDFVDEFNDIHEVKKYKNVFRENGDYMHSGKEILEDVIFLMENASIEPEEAFEIVSEGRILEYSSKVVNDVKKEYADLKKTKPALAGAIKGFIYPYLGGYGGAVHGAVKYNKELNKKNGKPDEWVIIKQTLIGMGYLALAKVITPFGTAALSAAVNSKQNKKKELLDKKYGIHKEDGELLVDNEVLYVVMNENNLYFDEALDLILESYENELEQLKYDDLFNNW